VTTQQQAPPRLEARLVSAQALRGAMQYRRLTIRELAVACGRPSYRSTLGNLHSGARTTCSPHLARRIEEALCVAPGLMFELRVCRSHIESATTTTAPRRRNAA
jgi:hypothetical protein